ncbi:MAG: hypothetical protein ACK50J_05105, partial [Planctomyces sp.]
MPLAVPVLSPGKHWYSQWHTSIDLWQSTRPDPDGDTVDGSEQDLLSILRRITRVIRLENAMNHLVFGAWAGLLRIASFLSLRESVSDE